MQRLDQQLKILHYCLLGFTLGTFPIQAGDYHPSPRTGPTGATAGEVKPEQPKALARPAAPKLPPMPDGVTELKFKDFFVLPMGDRGLELTETFRKLAGQRIRILGFMVKQETNPPGMFLLAPTPVELHERESDCFIDSLPPSVLHVAMPCPAKAPVTFTPGLMLLTGKLEIGNHLECDGRLSVARLHLDPPDPSRKMRSPLTTKGAERLWNIPDPDRSATQ